MLVTREGPLRADWAGVALGPALRFPMARSRRGAVPAVVAGGWLDGRVGSWTRGVRDRGLGRECECSEGDAGCLTRTVVQMVLVESSGSYPRIFVHVGWKAFDESYHIKQRANASNTDIALPSDDFLRSIDSGFEDLGISKLSFGRKVVISVIGYQSEQEHQPCALIHDFETFIDNEVQKTPRFEERSVYISVHGLLFAILRLM